MKRLMFVTNSLSGGGAERAMNLVVNELALRGFPVSLVPINRGENDLVVPTCQVFPINRHWRGGFTDTVLSFFRFQSVVRRWKPDVLILNCDIPELFGSIALIKTKLVVVEHANPAWSTRLSFGKLVRFILYVRRSRWVSVSEHLRVWPTERNFQTVLVNPLVPPIVKNEPLIPVTHDDSILRLVFVGRLAKAQKRPDWVVRIASQLGLPAILIGVGQMQNELIALAKGLNAQVEFPGFQRDPWEFVKSGDLLIVPSAWEGDGLVVLEAIARDVPLLLSDIPEFKRFKLPQSNYCKQPEDFVSKIETINTLSCFRISATQTKFLLETRSIERVGDDWARFIDSI